MDATKSMASCIGDLVSFLSSVKGDLSNVTAPTSFLAPSSVVEVGHCWAQRPRIFAAPALEADPQKRALLVLKLVLAALRSQLYVAGAPGVSIKKPLNAFLGELFLANWTEESTAECDANDEKKKRTETTKTQLVAEQVSHHPPITAMHISAPDHGIRADGYARVEMTFNGNVHIRQVGHAVLHIDAFGGEDHLIPLPDVKVRGFLSACLYPEITGTYHIVGSSGYVSELRFTGAGVLRGKKNSFEARTFHKSDPKTTLYRTAGCWSEGGWTVRDGKSGKVIETYEIDAAENGPARMELPAVEQMDPWESRRAWDGVIAGLGHGGDSRVAVAEKTKLEQAQRRMRAEEARKGDAWEPLLFESLRGDDHEVFHRLSEGTDWELCHERTKGVWRVRDGKLGGGGLQRPFRGELTPWG